jgi:hypothetical protein
MKDTDTAVYSREEALEKLTAIGTESLKIGRSFGTHNDINVPSRKDRSKTLPFFTGDRVEDSTAYNAVIQELASHFVNNLMKNNDKTQFSARDINELSHNILTEISVFRLHHVKEINAFIDRHSKIYRKGAPGFHKAEKVEIDTTALNKRYKENIEEATLKIRENVKKDLESTSCKISQHINNIHSYLSKQSKGFVKSLIKSREVDDKKMER